jgi:hypothetical protein
MATLYKTDGTQIEVKPSNGTDFQLAELYELLGCSMIEVVRMKRGLIMIVDEEGKLSRKQANPEATKIAHGFESIFSNDFIVGTALVCREEELK